MEFAKQVAEAYPLLQIISVGIYVLSKKHNFQTGRRKISNQEIAEISKIVNIGGKEIVLVRD